MHRYTRVLTLLLLAACGGGSDVTRPPDPPAEPEQFTLAITGTGSGTGRVRTSAGSQPALDCTLAANAQPTGTCSGTYSEGTVVGLVVTPEANSTFDGWSGDALSCSTALTCSISMTGNKTAIAQLSAVASVEITSSAHYIDPDFGFDGAVIWVVEVRNNTNQLVESARIEFTSHDASGTILTSDFTFIGPIPAGETRASQSYATYLGTEATVGIKVGEVRLGTGDAGLSSAQIASSNWRVDPDFAFDGAIIWTVEVLNPTSVQLESVRVDFVTYDSSGKIVAADFTFVGPIPPGESRASEGFADYHGMEATAKFQMASVR